jgi:hypothetical protein
MWSTAVQSIAADYSPLAHVDSSIIEIFKYNFFSQGKKCVLTVVMLLFFGAFWKNFARAS